MGKILRYLPGIALQELRASKLLYLIALPSVDACVGGALSGAGGLDFIVRPDGGARLGGQQPQVDGT